MKYARVLSEVGRFEEALALFDQDIATVRIRLGDNHPRVADIVVGRGDTLLHLGRQEEARDAFKEALGVYERAFGKEHRRIPATWTLLANTYPDGSPEAVDLLERALEIQRRTLSEHDTEIGYTAANLGSRLARAGRPDEGLERLEEAWKMFEAAYGPDHPVVGATRQNLGVAHFNAGRVDEALSHMAAALRIDRAHLDPSHPTLISALANVGLLYYARQRYVEAIPLLKEALVLRSTYPDPKDPERAFTLNMALAASYRHLGRLDEAKRAVDAAVAMAEKSQDSWKLIQTEGERAEQMWERGEHLAALDYAVALRRRIKPADAPENDDTIASLDAAIARWRRELGRP
jgi:tetratricopeptide (TPR) repeat protein